MPKPKTKYTREQVLKAVAGSKGITATVAKRLRCEWHTAASYIEKWEDTKRAMDDEGENILDAAESKLFEAIEEGDPWAIKTLLYTKGRKRGYTQRQEIAGVDDAPLKIVYTPVDPQDEPDDEG